MVLSSRFSPRLVWQEDSARLDDCDGYQHCGMWLGWGPVSLSPFEIPCRVESRGLGSLVGPDWVESDKERLERLGATWTCWFLGRLNSPMYFFSVEGVYEDQFFSRVYPLDNLNVGHCWKVCLWKMWLEYVGCWNENQKNQWSSMWISKRHIVCLRPSFNHV